MDWFVKTTGLLFSVTVASNPAGDLIGSKTCRPLAGTFWLPAPGTTVKLNALPLHVSDPKDELLRKSSQSSICLLETIGTPRGGAEARIASDSGIWATSVCALMVKAP